MIRRIAACVAAAALSTVAFAQQPTQEAVQEVRSFTEELMQHMAKDPEAYTDRISFPVQLSVVTADGEVLSGTFEEKEFRLLGRMVGDEIRLHAAQQALIEQADRHAGAADIEEDAAEEEMVVEEELALMPRHRIAEEAQIRTIDTRIQFLGENVAFVRTTVSVGEERPSPAAAGEASEENEAIVEEELALRPERGQAYLDVGTLLIKEEGEWRVKSIVTEQTRLYEHSE